MANFYKKARQLLIAVLSLIFLSIPLLQLHEISIPVHAAVEGIYGWTKTIGGTDEDKGYSISVDNTGNVYVTGFLPVQ